MLRAAESLLILQNKRKRLRKIIGRMQIKLGCTCNQPKSVFFGQHFGQMDGFCGWFLQKIRDLAGAGAAHL
jgi:hypothetical protein